MIATALLLAAASVPIRPTVPSISMQVGGTQIRMDTIAILDDEGRVEIRAIGPSTTIPMRAVEVPGVETTTPTISYEHPYALKSARTGQIVAFDQIVVRREARFVSETAMAEDHPKQKEDE